jgi:hypothetical protein
MSVNMKEIILKSLKELVADRYLLVLISVMLLMSFIFATIIGFSIHSSELQLMSHYSVFGVRGIYTDQWFYLFVFVIFELIVAFLHAIIAIKMLVVKSRSIAIMFGWLGFFVVILGFITALAVITPWMA